ncbi:MAG TPA: CHASE4 domain-containing protein [Methanoregulaceae archaeon]|nr:CHASE4 domain-containing protein [Methanoregulaceae archaeon]
MTSGPRIFPRVFRLTDPERKNPNSLQTSTFIIITAIFVGLLITVLIISRIQVMGGFTSFEQQAMVDNVNRTLSGIDDRIDNLDTLALVWAGSEITRTILASPASTPVLNEFPDSTFTSADANVLIILDRKGHTVAHKYISLESAGQQPTPRSLLDALENQPFYQVSSGKKGILNLDSGPVLVAVRPVVDEGQIIGYLLIGRNLDTTELGKISDPLGSHASVEPVGPGNLGSMAGSVPPGAGDTIVSPESETMIAGYRILPDIRGGTPLVLKTELPRPIYRYGIASMNYIFLSLLIVGFIFGGAILVLLEYSVISRITRLNREVQYIGSSGNSSGRVKPRGNDEITSLAESVNLMLSSLDQSREKLKQSESRYANLLNNANDCIFSITTGGILLSYNRQLKRLAKKVGSDLVIGEHLALITTPETRDNFIEALGAGLSKEPDYKGTRTFELVIAGTDESEYILESSVQYIPATADSSPLFFCISRDITERKNYEASLVAVTQKLQLLSAITRHDIKNQLTILFGYLDLSKRINDSSDIGPMCEKMERVARRILSQIEFTGDYQELGIKTSTWQDLLITFKYAISHLDMLPVRQVIDVKPVEIFVDPLFEKAIGNLVDNSLVHGEHVTEIRLSSAETSHGLLVVYEDNGIGIPDKDKENIFKQGFGKINGFGLFLTREILSITKISIRETGEPGKGARFEIFIPRGKFRFSPGVVHGITGSSEASSSSAKD